MDDGAGGGEGVGGRGSGIMGRKRANGKGGRMGRVGIWREDGKREGEGMMESGNREGEGMRESGNREGEGMTESENKEGEGMESGNKEGEGMRESGNREGVVNVLVEIQIVGGEQEEAEEDEEAVKQERMTDL